MSPAVARARGVLGTRFRLGGRDPAFGLDCVGLVAWATGARAPAGYPLRGGHPAAVAALLDGQALRVAEPGPGDVLLMAVGAGQLHLGIVSGDGTGGEGLIHADAGLRRVVERPGPPPWPVIGAWRFLGSS